MGIMQKHDNYQGNTWLMLWERTI